MTRQTRSNIHGYDEHPGTFQMRGFHQFVKMTGSS
jgi:hypothetical protein